MFLNKIYFLIVCYNFFFQGRIDLFENETPDDVDHCIIYYNQAVIYYNQKQYEKALNLLNKIFSLIQPMGMFLYLTYLSVIVIGEGGLKQIFLHLNINTTL